MSKMQRHGMTLVIDNKEVLNGSHFGHDGSSVDGAQNGSAQTNDSLLESLFITALERATQSSWRLVCASLAAEQMEPFRTCFLSKETRDLLLLWHTWQNSDVCRLPPEFEPSGNDGFCPETLVLNVDIYRPLESGSARY